MKTFFILISLFLCGMARGESYSDFPCFQEVSSELRRLGFLENMKLAKGFEVSTENRSGRSEFIFFNGHRTASLSYGPRADGSTGSVVSIEQRSLLNEVESAALTYDPKCRIESVKIGSFTLNQEKCRALRALNVTQRNDTSVVSGIVGGGDKLIKSCACGEANKLINICSSIGGVSLKQADRAEFNDEMEKFTPKSSVR